MFFNYVNVLGVGGVGRTIKICKTKHVEADVFLLPQAPTWLWVTLICLNIRYFVQQEC